MDRPHSSSVFRRAAAGPHPEAGVSRPCGPGSYLRVERTMPQDLARLSKRSLDRAPATAVPSGERRVFNLWFLTYRQCHLSQQGPASPMKRFGASPPGTMSIAFHWTFSSRCGS